jgi:hypothetical protein
VTISFVWTLAIGPVAPGAATDYTSRMARGNVNQSCQPGSIGRGSFSFRLNNFDGAFTPGGGGAYSNIDWFSQGVFLSGSVNSTVYGPSAMPVFHGIVSNVDFYDDGKTSYVDFLALDSWTIAGRTKQTTTTAYYSAAPAPAEAIQQATVGNFGFPNNMFPALGTFTPGLPYNSISLITELSGQVTPSGGGNELGTIYGCDNGVAQLTNLTFADFLNQAILPANISVAWPTTINQATYTYLFTVHNLNLISRGMSQSTTGTTYKTSYVFSNDGVSPFQIAFNSIDRGYNIDQLVNTSTIQYSTSTDTTTSTVTDNTTIEKYGARAISYTSMMGGYPYGALGLPTPQQSNAIATEWVNRFSNIRFVPASITTTFKTAFSNVANEFSFWTYFNALLDIRKGLWNKATVTSTGAGGITQTNESIISGRQLRITPNDTQMVVQLLNWQDNHSFYLNEDQLNEDRVL